MYLCTYVHEQVCDDACVYVSFVYVCVWECAHRRVSASQFLWLGERMQDIVVKP